MRTGRELHGLEEDSPDCSFQCHDLSLWLLPWVVADVVGWRNLSIDQPSSCSLVHSPNTVVESSLHDDTMLSEMIKCSLKVVENEN